VAFCCPASLGGIAGVAGWDLPFSCANARLAIMMASTITKSFFLVFPPDLFMMNVCFLDFVNTINAFAPLKPSL